MKQTDWQAENISLASLLIQTDVHHLETDNHAIQPWNQIQLLANGGVGHNVYKWESEPYVCKNQKQTQRCQEAEQRSNEVFSASGDSWEGLREGVSVSDFGRWAPKNISEDYPNLPEHSSPKN